jgi:hypothetical protein
MRPQVLIVASLLFLSACLSEVPSGPGAPPEAPAVPPGVLVMLRDAPEDSAAFDAALRAVLQQRDSATVAERWPSIGAAWVLGLAPEEQRLLLEDGRVASLGPIEAATIEQATGNWALDRLDQRTLPLDNRYENRMGSGAGVRIYVFDTGLMASHTQFTGRVIPGPDFLENPNGLVTHTNDCHGHGTLAASAAAGRTLGTAPGAEVQSVRVMTCQGQGISVDIVRGIDFVLAERRRAPSRPAVVNMSLAFVGGSTFIDDAVRRLVAAGVPVVVSAGNSARDACNQSPAREPSAITVGAMMNPDTRASFSNYGPCVDVWAPGVNVPGAHVGSPTMSTNWNGTSASAPYVAGLVAAYLSRFPTATPAQVARDLVGRASVVPLAGIPGESTARVAFANFGDNSLPLVSPPPQPRVTFSTSCVGRECYTHFELLGGASPKQVEFRSTGLLTHPPLVESRPNDANRGTARWRTRTAGTFVATAIVTFVDGRADTVRRSYKVVNAPPTISAASAACEGEICVLSGTATDDEPGLRTEWRLANRQVRTGSRVEVTLAPGSQSATFVATDDLGVAVNRSVTFIVTRLGPTARLAARCSERTCTLDATNSSFPTPIATGELDAGDGSAPLRTTTDLSRTVTYRNAGTYRARVTVTDRAGRSSTATTSVTVR